MTRPADLLGRIERDFEGYQKGTLLQLAQEVELLKAKGTGKPVPAVEAAKPEAPIVAEPADEQPAKRRRSQSVFRQRRLMLSGGASCGVKQAARSSVRSRRPATRLRLLDLLVHARASRLERISRLVPRHVR